MPTIETDRLLLHPWREADRRELERLWSDPVVKGGRNLTRWIGKIGLDELADWPDVHKVEVGFELHAEWWGQGLATEGARAALAFGFEEHCLERIISVTAASNLPARRVMEKAGLRYEGTRHWKSPDVPVVWYAIERSAWKRDRA